jgi:AcrR family transcriptional regulator
VTPEPRGPHGGGSQCRASEQQRERLVDAFTKVAAERGYANTEVGEVTSVAGLPRNAFSAHFSSKRQCLLAAYDDFFDRLIEEIEDSMDPQGPWHQQVEAGLGAALEFVIEGSRTARLFAVEAPSLGPPAIERYGAAIQRIVALFRYGRALSPEASRLPPLTEPVLVAGVAYLVTAALLAEDDELLSRLEPRVVEVLLLPYAGPSEKREPAA